ncbi:MAG TPA: PKD domain-containing protein [Phycisphaerae bacterium]|nr:PKD domain-containing protein [Phycisphaerae bacterium]
MHTKAHPSRNGSAARLDSRLFTARTARRLARGLTLCLVAGLVLGSQCMAPPDDSDDSDDSGSPSTRKTVTIFTNVGRITIELFPEQAPKAVAQFLKLLDEDAYYDGKIFHSATSKLLTAGAYDVNLQDGEDVPFVNESNNGLKNIRGRVALYGPTDEEEGKPQFIINLASNPNLDFSLNASEKAAYTVIGRVKTGMDIADKIAAMETISGTSSGGDSLPDIPLTEGGAKVRIIEMTAEKAEEPENTAPVADAGPDRSVEPNSKVTLDGSKSYDPDGDPIQYEWSLTDESADALEEAKLDVTLDDPTSANPSFTAPRPASPLDIVFELRVTDDRGAFSTDTVTITLNDNVKPVADAGPDRSVEPNSKVTLDGSKSYDPDGDPIQYEWSLTDESADALEEAKLDVTLDDPTSANPSFTAPRPASPLDIVFELRVTDDRGAFSTDTVTITLNDNVKPVADAGADKTVHPGETVQLDGSASSDADPDTTLTYAWILSTESAQLLADLGLPAPLGGTSAKYSFTAPAATVPLPLIFELTVTDDKGASDTDTVEVKILPIVFNTPVSYFVGGQPTAIASGDFDGDSKPDIAVAKAATNEVAVLFNDGEGGLLDPVVYAVGLSPESIVAADFNEDGNLDIAVAARNDSKLCVLVNHGDGTFAPATSYAMGFGPVSLVSGEFVAGSGPDVAAVNTTAGSTNSLAVLVNDGQAAFPSGQADLSLTGKNDEGSTITPVGARVMAAGRVDTDNLADLVVAYSDRKVFVLLGDSSKTEGFRFGSYFEAGPSGANDPRAILLADVSGDSRPDVLVALNAINQIALRKNNGSGRFGFEALYETGAGPAGLVAADLDGDSDNDVAVANETANTISLLQNKGTGSFKTKVDLSLADGDAGPVGLAAADLNEDEAIDLAVVNRISGTVTVFLNLTVTADAGEDQDVLVNETVTLHGSGRSREGATFTYHWKQIEGPPVTLSDAHAAEPTFTAPAETCELVFRLTATDDQGATATDTVRVDVYIQTASGLRYCDVVKGTGAVVQSNSTVSVLYTGRLNNRAGDEFDSTAPGNQPREFGLSSLIVGWQEGLANYDMRAGGKRLLIIPPELGYGSTPREGIPANSTLWFEIEVLDIVK